MRRVAYALLAVALLAPSEPRAEMNPVTIISSGLKRPEIVLVLDTSGSMHQAPGSSSSIGTDCNKDSFGLVDLVGDGMCTGTETTSSSPNDCISSNSSTSPGQALACGGSATGTSRMFAVKRVLRGLLPALRTSANFGLVTFQQSGYYEYFKASGSCNCSTCPGSTTVVSCTYQNCSSASCDSGNPQWKNGHCSCGKNKPAPVCTNTTAVQPVCSDPEDCSTCSCPAATTRTCKNIGSPPCCSCGPGETLQCTNDGDCTTCTCRKSNWKAVGCCSCPTGFKMSDRCSE
ncbi:MAG: hypothetical protein KC503_38310, partial [Myxococcales bacterium]|nr:hypothetical protein [Myxococcales bacterium]